MLRVVKNVPFNKHFVVLRVAMVVVPPPWQMTVRAGNAARRRRHPVLFRLKLIMVRTPVVGLRG